MRRHRAPTRIARTGRTARGELLRAAKKNQRRIVPRWVPLAASLTLVLLITVTVNVRAYFELRQEQDQNVDLNRQAQQLTNENLGIQEEIYYLKHDTDTIEREARKYGFIRPKQEEKVSRADEIDKAEKSTNRQLPTR